MIAVPPVSVSGAADRAFLDGVAAREGGAHVALAGRDPSEAATVGVPVPVRVRVVAEGAEAVEPAAPTVAAPGSTVSAFGTLRGDEGTVTLEYASGDRTASRRIRVRAADAVQMDGMLRRYRGHLSLSRLLASPAANRRELADVGRRFGLVTPHTSLIVLERLEHYIEFGVEPPPTLPGFRREYGKAVASRSYRWEKSAQSLAERWKEHVQWHERDFVYPPGFRYVGQPRRVRRGAPSGTFDLRIPVEQDAPADARQSPTPPPDGLETREYDLDSTWTPFYRPFRRWRYRLRTPGSPPGERAEADAPGAPMETWLFRVEAGVLDSARTRRRPTELALGDETGPPTPRPPQTPAGAAEPSRPPQLPVVPSYVFQDWDSRAPYAEELKRLAADELYPAYLRWRRRYVRSPDFFADCARVFLEHGLTEQGVRVLSNVAEVGQGSPDCLRLLAGRLAHLGLHELAAPLLELLVDLEPEQPQHLRNLALSVAQGGQLERAADLLSRALSRGWYSARATGRRHRFELIALNELNHLIQEAQGANPTDVSADPRFVNALEFDLRIVVTWDSAPDREGVSRMPGVRLWVVEPSGEFASRNAVGTTIGGRLLQGMTREGGPAEYALRKAMSGTYEIRARASLGAWWHGPEWLGDDDDDDDDDDGYERRHDEPDPRPVTVFVRIFTNYGRPNEHCRSLSRRLLVRDGTVTVGRVQF